MILLKKIQIQTISDLRSALQSAIELEHATIPPYLTANFTLYNTGNDRISELIGSVVGEEMLHLSIAANVLNAVGGKPVLNNPGFIPRYPGPLPGGVESGLKVPLEKFSKDLIFNVFMVIEEPEKPVAIKSMGVVDNAMTIGQFYGHIKNMIQVLESQAKANGKTIFTGNVEDQVTYEKFYPSSLLFPVKDEATALKAIDIIVDQGEGTHNDPFVKPQDDAGIQEPAHYYRFEEIYVGKTLMKLGGDKYTFGAPLIPFNPEKIPNMWPNPKMNDYPKDSQAYINSRFFNYNYTSLLNSLHIAFNGNPKNIDNAMGLMFALRLYALKLLAIPDPNHPGYVAGPSFEYVTSE